MRFHSAGLDRVTEVDQSGVCDANDRRRAIVVHFARRYFGELGVEVAGRFVRKYRIRGGIPVRSESLGLSLGAVDCARGATFNECNRAKS